MQVLVPSFVVKNCFAATVLWLCIPHFKNSGDFQLELPNPLNFSFNLVTLLWIGILFVPASKLFRRTQCAHAHLVAGRAHVEHQNYDVAALPGDSGVLFAN